MAAPTITSTGNFPSARYAQMIQKTLLEWGDLEYKFAKYMEEKTLDKGYSQTYRVVRRKRVKLSITAAAESVSPTPVALDLDYVEGTSTQYVFSVQFSDTLDLVALHDMITHATMTVGDYMERLRGKIDSDAFLAGTNVMYANSTVTARSGLAITDVPNSDMLRRMRNYLRKGDRIIGAAPRWSGSKYALLCNESHIGDFEKDATFLAAASRGQQGQGSALKDGVIASWEGFDIDPTNVLPEFTNLNDGLTTLTLTNNTALSYTSLDTTGTGTGMNGFTVNSTGSGTWAAVSYGFVVTRRDLFRGFEEDISSIFTLTPTASTLLQITTPTDASGRFLYRVYAGTVSSGNYYIIPTMTDINGSTTVSVSAPPTSGVTAPVAPAPVASGTRNKIYPMWAIGKQALCRLKLDGLRTYITGGNADSADPAAQRRTVAAKFNVGSFVQRDTFFVRGEAATAFASTV